MCGDTKAKASERCLVLLAAIPAAILCLLGGAPPAEAALKGYDCSRNTSIATDVSILQLIPKWDSIDRYRGYAIAAEIIQRNQSRQVFITAYVCKVKFVDVLIGADGTRKNISQGTEIIGRAACLNAHKTKTLNLSGWDINLVRTDGIPTYTTTNQSKEYEITLSRKEGTVDIEKDIVLFDGGVACDYSGLSCLEDQDEMFWVPDDLITRGDRYKAMYVGNIWMVGTNQSILSDNFTYAVVQRDFNKALAIRVFDSGSIAEYRTDIPGVYIVPLTRHFFQGSVPYLHSQISFRGEQGFEGDPREKNFKNAWKISSKDLEELASKTFETVYLTSSLDAYDAVEVGRRRCKADAADDFRRLDSVAVGSRVEYGRKGVISVRTGKNEFTTYVCRVSNVRLKTIGKDILVEDEQGSDKFLNPLSRVLSDVAPVSKRQTNDMYVVEETMSRVSDCTLASNWLMIVLFALFSLWALAVVVRVIRLIAGRVRNGDGRGTFASPGKTPNDEKGATKRSLVVEVSSLLRPPFVK